MYISLNDRGRNRSAINPTFASQQRFSIITKVDIHEILALPLSSNNPECEAQYLKRKVDAGENKSAVIQNHVKTGVLHGQMLNKINEVKSLGNMKSKWSQYWT